MTDVGALIVYGPNVEDLWHRAAIDVVKVLLTNPQSVLIRADQVTEP
ncbi:MAG: hypothetical protein ACREKS_00075 [Candidatus Rokuibacteriota bacterium]